jgi:hypothetical protein
MKDSLCVLTYNEFILQLLDQTVTTDAYAFTLDCLIITNILLVKFQLVSPRIGRKTETDALPGDL